MPYIIPETMPQDWIVAALDSLDIPVGDDRADRIEREMKATYIQCLNGSKVPTLMGQLRVACIATAQRYRNMPDAKPER